MGDKPRGERPCRAPHQCDPDGSPRWVALVRSTERRPRRCETKFGDYLENDLEDYFDQQFGK